MQPTILSSLSKQAWTIESSRFSRGIDWAVEKAGSQWKIGGQYFSTMKKFKTKTLAYQAYVDIILAEARLRAMKGKE